MFNKRVLVFINPYGGEQTSPRIWRDIVKPMFDKGGIKSVPIVLTHQGHAHEIAASRSGIQYDGFVVVAGDGVVNEVLNGLASKATELCSQSDDDVEVVAAIRSMFIAVIPGGSSNGMATSCGGRDAFEATKNVVCGRCHDVDLYKTFALDGSIKPMWDCLLLNWALIGDHDYMVEESCRWMGKTLKGIFVPVYCILKCKQYHGTICFEAASLNDRQKQASSYNDPSSLPVATRGGDSCGDWRQIDASFVILTISNVPDAASDAKLTPHVELDDGGLDILVVRGNVVGRLNLAKMFLKVEVGGHVGDGSPVEVYKARRASLFPDGGGNIAIGGEMLDYQNGGIGVNVRAGAARFVF